MDVYPSLKDIHLPILGKMATALGAVRTDNDIKFPNGSLIKMRYLEMAGSPLDNKSPIEGHEYHAILVDECQKVDSDYWLIFQTRARLTCKDINGRDCMPVIITSGVPQNTWWCAATLEQDGRVWRPKTGDNNYLPPGTEARLRAQMTDAMARAMLDGEELIQEGAIYSQYKESLYPDGSLIVSKPEWQSSRTMLAADLGVRWPHALLMVEDVARGAWIVTHEWAPDDVSIGELCRMILKDACLRKDWKGSLDTRVPIDRVIVDPAGLQRSDHDGRAGLDIWALPPPEGIGMMPFVERDATRKSVEEGIRRLQLALERQKILFDKDLILNGHAKKKDQRTIGRCLRGYRWDPKNPARPYNDGFHEHGCDALRYGFREVMWNVNPVPNLYTGDSKKAMDTISKALSQAKDSR
jgi:hypothetical protein